MKRMAAVAIAMALVLPVGLNAQRYERDRDRDSASGADGSAASSRIWNAGPMNSRAPCAGLSITADWMGPAAKTISIAMLPGWNTPPIACVSHGTPTAISSAPAEI